MTSGIESTSVRGAFTAVAAATAALIAAEQPARACTYSPVNAMLAAIRVPPMGPVIVDVTCAGVGAEFCEAGAPELVIERAGEPVEGSVELVRGHEKLFMAWTPAAPLTDGTRFQVRVMVPDYVASFPFEVLVDAAAEWTAPELDELAWSRDAVAEPVGERICCAGGFSCFGTCLAEREVLRATVELDDMQASYTPAYLYRMRWREAGAAERTSAWGRPGDLIPVRATFEQPAGSYCATLEVRSLVDDSMMQVEHCEEPDPAIAYGETRLAVHDGAFLSGDCAVPPGADRFCDPGREACEVPSQLLLEAWCDAWRPECAPPEPANPDQCSRVAAYCGEPSRDDAGAQPREDASDGARDGCSTRGTPGAAGSASALGCMLLLLVRRGRKKTLPPA